ncbi:hypothetical protein CC2G_000078 [Coprinopsis cinerea AmutBmut pab1-1]|nr:hypothetical protein CC2G_000078 [Coprinopsis cinerea AmutBmut pab1-1]
MFSQCSNFTVGQMDVTNIEGNYINVDCSVHNSNAKIIVNNGGLNVEGDYSDNSTHYHRPVNNIGKATNVNSGTVYGNVHQQQSARRPSHPRPPCDRSHGSRGTSPSSPPLHEDHQYRPPISRLGRMNPYATSPSNDSEYSDDAYDAQPKSDHYDNTWPRSAHAQGPQSFVSPGAHHRPVSSSAVPSVHERTRRQPSPYGHVYNRPPRGSGEDLNSRFYGMDLRADDPPSDPSDRLSPRSARYPSSRSSHQRNPPREFSREPTPELVEDDSSWRREYDARRPRYSRNPSPNPAPFPPTPQTTRAQDTFDYRPARPKRHNRGGYSDEEWSQSSDDDSECSPEDRLKRGLEKVRNAEDAMVAAQGVLSGIAMPTLKHAQRRMDQGR